MNTNREIHYRYSIFLLFLVIVALVTLKYFDVPSLVDKFSFALTLSSLLLAILAIFYTITSAQKQDLQLTKLGETQANLGAAATEIRTAAEDIRSFAREAPDHFKRLGSKLDDLQSMNAAKRQTAGTEEGEQQPPRVTALEIGPAQFSGMFARLHFSAMSVLYLFVKAHGSGTPIEAALLEELDIASFDYSIGVLNGLETTGLLAFKIHGGAIIAISSAAVLTESIEANIATVLEVLTGDTQRRLKERVERVRAIFDPEAQARK